MKKEKFLIFNTIFKKSKKGGKFFKQINKYWDKLFADSILIETEFGTQEINPQRTNNIMEQIFRELTRANKRKTGDASIARTIKGIVADTPLIRNLKDEKYMEMILGEKKTIEEVFAEVDIKIIRKKLREHQIYFDFQPRFHATYSDDLIHWTKVKNETPQRGISF